MSSALQRNPMMKAAFSPETQLGKSYKGLFPGAGMPSGEQKGYGPLTEQVANMFYGSLPGAAYAGTPTGGGKGGGNMGGGFAAQQPGLPATAGGLTSKRLFQQPTLPRGVIKGY